MAKSIGKRAQARINLKRQLVNEGRLRNLICGDEPIEYDIEDIQQACLDWNLKHRKDHDTDHRGEMTKRGKTKWRRE